MFYRIAVTLSVSRQYWTIDLVALIRLYAKFEKTHLVHLQLLLDHLVGYLYGLVLGGLTISDGVRRGLYGL